MKQDNHNQKPATTGSRNSPALKKYPFYFYLVSLFLPLLFFVVLEFLLRLCDYGKPIPQWITLSRNDREYIMLNPEIGGRYFRQIKSVPKPGFEPFRVSKQSTTFRVFILGSSSAAGYPYPSSGAFSRYIKHYLECKYPDADIEVINLAMTAVNSYTLRDLIPGVISQQPDLIIFYAGHNEYYGALGVGSAEFIGHIRPLVNLIIKSREIRLVQLLQNIISTISKWLFAARHNPAETLMARMIGEKQIPLHSSLYELGIRQFSGNMNDIMVQLKKYNIPVLLGTVTCNLKDQPPFASMEADSLPKASDVFIKARSSYLQGDFGNALNLFHRAKELDGLRFRAPEAINSVIRNLGVQYHYPVVDIDSVFRQASPHGITGDNLIVDHVHPTAAGHLLLGSAMVQAMEQNHMEPKKTNPAISAEQARQMAIQAGRLTRLDSTYAALRISFLKSGWPFRPERMPQLSRQDFTPRTYIDELALSMFLEEITWEVAHIKAALWYKKQDLVHNFESEMVALIDYLPFTESFYKVLIDGLIEKKDIEHAYPYLLKLHKQQSSAYSTKWLGIYYLYKKEYAQALSFLELSTSIMANDPQVQYNLAGAYFQCAEYGKALQAIEKCLSIQVNYPGAKIMQHDLLRIQRYKK